MNQNDYKTFVDAWKVAHEVMPNGKVLSVAAMQMIFETLSEYPIQYVTGAIKKHMKTGKFAPTPSDIIEIIDIHTKRQHIGADEAWAIALAAMDESETVVWTKEIAEAKVIAQEVFDNGDKQGARMAFRTAYERIIKTADKPKWFVTEGFDPSRRAIAVQKAVEKGLLSQDIAERYALPGPSITFAQLTHMADKQVGDKVVERLKEIKQGLFDEKTDEAARQREQERLKFEQHREHELKRAEELMRESAC